MKNIFLFIRRFFTFFVFLILQILCISFLIKYNKTYEAAFSNVAHSFTGKIDKRYNNIQYYFDLKKTNKTLAAENARLQNELSKYTFNADSLNKNKFFTHIDTLIKDSTGKAQKYEYFEAKVVNNTLSNDNNFITIQKGSLQGVQTGMAVSGPDGIVGQVVAVSPNYSVVMSLLNHNSHITSMLKNNYVSGYVSWDGARVNELKLNNIPKNTQVKKGDSVVTSNLTGIFPEGLMVGRVLNVKGKNESTNFYDITIATTTNFYTLQYVYVIKNNMYNEQKKLENKVNNK